MATDTISDLEQELIEATGIKTKKKENRQAFLHRLVEAVSGDDFPEDKWEALSESVQHWVNEAVRSVKSENDIPEFEVEEEPEEEAAGEDVAEDVETETETEDAASEEDDPRPRHLRQRETDRKSDAPVKAKKANNRAEGGVSGRSVLKKLIVSNPGMTKEQLTRKLEEMGIKLSSMTISTTRSETRDTMRAVVAAGGSLPEGVVL